MRVLIIDDPKKVQGVREYLEASGFECEISHYHVGAYLEKAFNVKKYAWDVVIINFYYFYFPESIIGSFGLFHPNAVIVGHSSWQMGFKFNKEQDRVFEDMVKKGEIAKWFDKPVDMEKIVGFLKSLEVPSGVEQGVLS